MSVLELGANVGMNLDAIRMLSPNSSLTGVEINQSAAQALQQKGHLAINSSIEDFEPTKLYDFVFTKGVLIHLFPESLDQTYFKINSAARRFVMFAEYFSTTPSEVDYRGHKGKLFRRDFAAEFLTRFPGYKQIGAGFISRNSPFPLDDVTWFLLEKTNSLEA